MAHVRETTHTQYFRPRDRNVLDPEHCVYGLSLTGFALSSPLPDLTSRASIHGDGPTFRARQVIFFNCLARSRCSATLGRPSVSPRCVDVVSGHPISPNGNLRIFPASPSSHAVNTFCTSTADLVVCAIYEDIL